MNNLKKHLLKLLLLFSVTALTALTQKSNNRFEVKFSDGTQLEMKSATAFLYADNKISILGYDKETTPSLAFQINLTPTDPADKRAFTKGYYHLNYSDELLNYVPGQSFSYDLNMTYLLLNNEKTLAEWNTGDSPKKGFVEIVSITETRIKGRFSCDLLQKYPTKGAKQSAEGTFDIKIVKK